MANVQGQFYRGETQRSGVTPTSPPNAVDEPVGPLNPPGSGNTTTYKQLGDTTDKNFIGKDGYIPVVVNENALTLQPNIPNTGVAVFGGVVFNSTTTVDIGIVKGYIVDNETDPLVSSVQYILKHRNIMMKPDKNTLKSLLKTIEDQKMNIEEVKKLIKNILEVIQ